MKSLAEKLNLLVASGFGLGLIVPFAPGTFGSLPGVALAYWTCSLTLWQQIAVCAVLTAAAVPICDRAEKRLGVKDDGRITADEWMLYPVALIGIPLSTLPWWSMIVFFAIIRALDIIKPPPARRLQSIPGGLGIVVDDLAANLYSLAANWGAALLIMRLGC